MLSAEFIKELLTTKYNFPRSIEDASVLFDNIRETWYNEIDLSKLDMGHCFNCILGQLLGNYYNKGDLFYNCPLPTRDAVFGYMVSSELWKEEIQRRRQNPHIE